MTVIPVASLQPSDLRRLGNNLIPKIRPISEQQRNPLSRSPASIDASNVTFDDDVDDMSVHDQLICE